MNTERDRGANALGWLARSGESEHLVERQGSCHLLYRCDGCVPRANGCGIEPKRERTEIVGSHVRPGRVRRLGWSRIADGGRDVCVQFVEYGVHIVPPGLSAYPKCLPFGESRYLGRQGIGR